MIRCALSHDALGCYLGLVPWYVYALVAGAAALLAWVLFDKIAGIIRGVISWGGWRAGVALLLGVLALLALVWPKRAQPEAPQYEHPDGEPLHPRSVKKARPTVLRQPGEDVKNWFERVTRPK